MSIRPPTSAEICRVTGAKIATRNVMRISDLSVVERVTLTHPSGAKQKAVLKTMHLALRHEPWVHQLAEDFPICAAKIITSENAEGTEAFSWMLIEAVEDYSADKHYTTAQMTQALIKLYCQHYETGIRTNGGTN